MQKITDHLYMIDKNKLKRLLKEPPVNAEVYVESMTGSSLKGVILTTEDELREVWDAGGRNWVGAGSDKPLPSFDDYLNAKLNQL